MGSLSRAAAASSSSISQFNMAPSFKFISRTSKDVPFEVPEGYHRVAFKERGEDADYCAWEAFCFGLAMQDLSIMTGMGSGLMAPVALGRGEEWRILEGDNPSRLEDYACDERDVWHLHVKTW